MKAVLLGATKGMGRALAQQMAARGDRLFLLGDRVEELAISARDLEVRGAAAPVGTAHCDLLQPDTFAPALDRAQQELDDFDTVVVTAGIFATQEQLENDPQLLARLLTADFTNTVLFCEESRKRLPEGKEGGTLCVFSSVAGERGRKPVVLYGAAKAGLSRYLEGLDHKFRSRGLRTICVKPGFVKTGMTAGLKPPPFAGTPDEVARRVLKAIDRGWPEVYAPWPWRWVMCVIRSLPRFVMRRIGF
jgi:NAD(P)-dependent dehydrogenase (short-subunit alcohol dehydrogenase family)